MYKYRRVLEAIVVVVAAFTVSGLLFMLQTAIPTAYATNSMAPNVVISLAVPSICEISLSPSISFGSLIAGSNSVTTSQNVLDSNFGNQGAFIAVDGGNWIGSNVLNVFGVGNTVWSSDSAVGFGSANALTTVPANTNIGVGAGSSVDVWFGLGIPAGQAASAYSQNIIVTNLC